MSSILTRRENDSSGNITLASTSVFPLVNTDYCVQQHSFPSTLVSPTSISYPHHISDGDIQLSNGTFEIRQQSMLKLLNETFKLVSDLTSLMEEEDTCSNEDPSSSVSDTPFPSKFTFKYPIKRSQLKILNISTSHNMSSGRSQSMLISEDDPMTRRMLRMKLFSSMNHIERLKIRLMDSTIRILVTGDVNSGKSTLVNALIGIPGLLPTDQQPCTSAYCEVVLGNSPFSLDQMKPVHAIPQLEFYDIGNQASYKVIDIPEMQHLSSGNLDFTSENDISSSSYAWFRIFLDKTGCDLFSTSSVTNNNESYSHDDSIYRLLSSADPSLNSSILKGNNLHNETERIIPHSCSLVDSPGLNHDTLQTMSLFAKQDDIDILIFVINAANHLTLSASEFLTEASREKEKIFIVVNKFDDIRDKQKCRRIVLQQIASLLPATFSDADKLVHFLSAKEFCNLSPESLSTNKNTSQSKHSSISQSLSNEFIKFQDSLTSWAIAPEFRAKTKLGPPMTLASALLCDLLELSLFNISALESAGQKLAAFASREITLEEKILNSSSLFTDPSQFDMDSDYATRAALTASLEQLGALVDGGGLMVSARLVQVLGGYRWPGAWSLFSLPGWINAFSKTLESVAISQLTICKSIAQSHGSEGASRIRAKAIQLIPEVFGSNELDIANILLDSTSNTLSNHSKVIGNFNEFPHRPDLSAFSVSGWSILLDVRSEMYQLVSYFGALGAISGITGLALRAGITSFIGTVTESYFKYGNGPFRGTSERGLLGSSFLFSSIIVIAAGIGAVAFSKDTKITQTTTNTGHLPGRFEAHLREKITTSIISRLQKSCWKEYESAAIATIARDATRSAVLGIQTRFQIRLSAVTRKREARQAYISLMEDRLAYFKGIQRKINVLLNEVESSL